MAFIAWLSCSLIVGVCSATSDYTALVANVSEARPPIIVMNNRAMNATSAYKTMMSTYKCMCRKSCQAESSCHGYSYYPDGHCLLTNTTSLSFLHNGQDKGYMDTWGDSSYLVGAVYEHDLPSEVNVGIDGLLYFVTPTSMKLSKCKVTCNGYYGFRLAKASNALTMSQLRLWKYNGVFVDLIINQTLYQRYKSSSCMSTGPGCPDYIYWADGTKLDRSLLISGEPITNEIDIWSDSFVMWSAVGIPKLDDTVSTLKVFPCLCQGNFFGAAW